MKKRQHAQFQFFIQTDCLIHRKTNILVRKTIFLHRKGSYNLWRRATFQLQSLFPRPVLETCKTHMATVRIVFSLWAAEMTRVVRKVPHFGAGIVRGTIPSGLPVFWILVPGCSRDGYGTSPNLWVQKKLVKFWQGTQDTWLFFAKFFWELLSYSVFDILRDLGDVILS